jgi:predicted membrane protein
VNQSGNNNGYFWGAILVVMGVLFLLDNFYILDFGNVISTFWPLILIAIGIKILMDRRKKEGPDDMASVSDNVTFSNSKTGSPGSISESNIFGDIILKIESESFSGGSISNVFGDISLDLSSVKLNQEITKIHVSGVFGDVKVTAPQGVPLLIRSNCVAGDISIRGKRKDGLFPNLTYQDDNYAEVEKKIDIQCSIVFGSINVY